MNAFNVLSAQMTRDLFVIAKFLLLTKINISSNGVNFSTSTDRFPPVKL